MTLQALKDHLIVRALEEGFSKVGICAPDAVPQTADRLRQFLQADHHGQMTWMAEREHWRGNAAALWPEARSVIMLAEVYTPEADPRDILAQPDRAAVSVYAQGKDYHDLVKRRPDVWGLVCHHRQGRDQGFRRYRAGDGETTGAGGGSGLAGQTHQPSIARSGQLVSLVRSSPPPICQKIRPRSAIAAAARLVWMPARPRPFHPYQLDARRCISYLTIEHKGPVDPDLRALMGNRIYGCDDCLAACPWNKFAQAAKDIGYQPKIGAPELAELVRLDDLPFAHALQGGRSNASGTTALSAMCSMRWATLASRRWRPTQTHCATILIQPWPRRRLGPWPG